LKAVILVGGEGTRLRPLTCNTPKAMVPVLNRPFLEHVLCHLKSHGVDTVVLALGHLSKSVLDYFGDGSRTRVKLVYSLEEEPLGTAGPVKLAAQHLGERFLVLNGDVFSDFNITAMIETHVKNKAVATLALIPVDDPSAYGVVETRTDGRVLRFIEKPKREEAPSNMINAGLYVLEPEVLDYIPPFARVMFENHVFPSLLNANRPVFGFQHAGYWIDIGTPQKYLQVNLDMAGKNGAAETCQTQTGAKAQVHQTARVSGPVVLSDSCFVGPEVEIEGPAVIGPSSRLEKGAHLSRSVVWGGTVLDEGCNVSNSVIANDCTVGKGSIVEACVVSDHVSIAPGTRLEPGSKIWPPDGR